MKTLVILLIVSLVVGGGILLCNVATGMVSGLTRMAINAPLLQANPTIDNRVLWGIAVAVAGIVLIWLGAGVAYGLARVSNARLRRVSALGFFIGIPLVLNVVFAGPLLLVWLSSFRPAIPNWKALDSVPERAIEIVNADQSSVYVRVASGAIYGCNPYGATTNCWFPAREPLTLSNTGRRIPVGAAVNPPKNVVSSIGISFFPVPEASAEVYYAVLSDGSVWWWRHDGPHALTTLLGWLLPLGVAMLIFLLFAPIYLGAGIFRVRHRSSPPTSVSN